MIEGDEPDVLLAARVCLTRKEPVIDEVGGEQLPYGVQVTMGLRFVKAAHHCLVFLSGL